MDYKAQVIVSGAKRINDTIDGKKYDSTTLFVQIDLDESTGNAKGQSTQPFAWGASDNFARIAHLPMPFSAEVTIRNVTNGRGVGKQVVTDLKPLQPVKG